MKWFYAFNTQDEENESYDGNEFIVDNISDVEFDEILDESEKRDDQKRSKSAFERIWKYSGMVVLLTAIGFVAFVSEFSLDELEDFFGTKVNVLPYLAIVVAVCAVIFIIGCFKFGAENKESGFKGLLTRLFLGIKMESDDSYDDDLEKRLEIPSDALDVDLLSFDYDDSTDMSERFTECTNFMVKIFADDENFYISDLESKFAFKKSDLKRITTVRAKMSMLLWNKKTSYKKDPYDRYRITKSKGKYEITTYYVLEVEKDGETWGIAFPCYDLSAYQLVTGLTAEY